jgi:proteasome accessory factor C
VIDAATAQAQLERILHMLPLAARGGGATYDELAGALDVPREQVIRDLEEVTAREFYHPAGSVTDIQVGFLPDRVTMSTTGQFRRPVRLTLGEAAALHLGLRVVAAERNRPELLSPLRAVEEQLGWAVPGDVAAHVLLTGDPAASDRLRALIIRAAREHRRCRLQYLKPDGPAPEERPFDPYVVVHSEGRWYTIGLCHRRGEPRVFRVDRIMEAELLDERFDPEWRFDPAEWVSGGRVFRAVEETAVTVRYGPRIARWLVERGEGQAEPDGSVVVVHDVADPGWIVRHVAQYGPDAEVLSPEPVRAMVREAAERIVAPEDPPPPPPAAAV